VKNFDQFVWAMWILYLARPSSAEPDDTGAYFIGACGRVPEKTWFRDTPYSLAQRELEESQPVN